MSLAYNLAVKKRWRLFGMCVAFSCYRISSLENFSWEEEFDKLCQVEKDNYVWQDKDMAAEAFAQGWKEFRDTFEKE